MRKIAAWLSSWATTLRIMLVERQLYRELQASIDAPIEDFDEVSKPE